MGVMGERRRFSVEEYHRLGTAGILQADERLELIEGELFQMAPIGSAQASFVGRLTRAFEGLARHGALLWVRSPIALGTSEPQPDLTVLRGREDCYESALPGPADTLLVIEVADACLAYDRDVKVPLYARNAVPEVWIVDVSSRVLDIFREPGPAGYSTCFRPYVGEVVHPVLLPGLRIDLRALFKSG
jgi:Uma2 family endonuclease